MKTPENTYESLRQPGIRGSVVARDYESMLIYDRAGISLSVHTGMLGNGAWDFGYTLNTPDRRETKLPGEGSGWFRNKNDAVLYALGMLRTRFDVSKDEIVLFIDRKIYGLTNSSLFDSEI